ncbi:hypothetical protein JAAARDRAFT_194458 [Jaapia argillacea MUCL 33604]|uniref:Uncharacterized protein n=1 Tax=Jaapia argillacea MUCL 33604 TaxID=933084 RepID=A0A067Q1C6_9AGAM|nr:hypothetical protein JAAARDRAFT_194458 [Jaapia argillacea MUCL 33604]
MDQSGSCSDTLHVKSDIVSEPTLIEQLRRSPLPSPIPHLLGKNIPPRPDQVPAVQAFLTQQQLDIDRLDAEVSRLQAQIVALVQDRHEAHVCVLAGITRLPRELLSNIFVDCLDDDSRTLGVPDIRRAPILLTRVCRHWREVAIKTSRLWCHLQVTPEYSPRTDRRTTSYTSIVAEWLARAATSPLDLTVSAPNHYHTESQVEISVVAATL